MINNPILPWNLGEEGRWNHDHLASDSEKSQRCWKGPSSHIAVKVCVCVCVFVLVDSSKFLISFLNTRFSHCLPILRRQGESQNQRDIPLHLPLFSLLGRKSLQWLTRLLGYILILSENLSPS